MSMNKTSEPKGALVSTSPALFPSPIELQTILPSLVQSVTLTPLSSSHIEGLYSALGGAQNAHIWRYIGAGPYHDLETFREFVESIIENPGNLAFAILKHDHSIQTRLTADDEVGGTPVGIISLGPIIPAHRTVEIGITLSPQLQRTTAGTETLCLLLRHCFEDLGYRRVEWKTDNLNEPSKRAAVRLGFVLEAVFRKHMIVKGRNRDTAWYSVIDDDWIGGVQAALEEWLDRRNFDGNGRQMRNLEDCMGKKEAPIPHQNGL